MSERWQPSAHIKTLQERAQILAHIRHFFNERNVLEVETPSLSQHTITDPYLQALSTLHTEPGANESTQLYLQTSPEYAMKRLLAAGSGDVFQICKAYRDDEVGRFHNPEFTMLEWYRLGFSMQDLIDELKSLLERVLPIHGCEQFTYSELFVKYCGFDPIDITLDNLVSACKSCGLGDYILSLQEHFTEHNQIKPSLLKDSALQVLFNQKIEPNIGKLVPTVVTHFPATQASLANIDDDGRCAQRFEVYFKGIELANGFHELRDAALQQQRFNEDNRKRQAMNLHTVPIDPNFIAALTHGLPACAGVALGIDRLIMLALNKGHIKEVLSFYHGNC